MLNYVTNSDTGDYIEDMAKEYDIMTVQSVTYTEFERQAADLFDKCFARLLSKGIQYAGHEDRFGAFKKAANGEGCIPEEIARRYMLKHTIALKKLLEDIENGRDTNRSKEYLEEIIGDIICYYVLIYGMLVERIECNENKKL
ncbi:MAG: hypothetical protein WC343_04505 [Bacilli bacterium]|jgi:hypothetical protein